jgi:hypothetical protein
MIESTSCPPVSDETETVTAWPGASGGTRWRSEPTDAATETKSRRARGAYRRAGRVGDLDRSLRGIALPVHHADGK